MFNQMVVDDEELDEVFHALAHAARRGMLARLVDRDLTIGQLGAPLAMSLAAASKHVMILERAGLVRRTIEGRRHMCRLDGTRLVSATEWLSFYERYWTERLDALGDLFDDHDTYEKER